MKPGAIVAIACMLAVTSAQAAQWTADGLTVTLADATGAVEAISVDGNELALASGTPSALCYREFTLAPEESAQTALALDFEGDEVTWTQVFYRKKPGHKWKLNFCWVITGYVWSN